jgi:hypothetical protein
MQIVEGTAVPIRVNVSDDVQVRNVELLVDGQVVRNDVSFPFDFSAIAVGSDPNAANITVQARATDTGGNSTLSAPLVLDLVPDTFAPTLTSVLPADGATRSRGSRYVRATFSEPMDAQTLTGDNIRLEPVGSPDAPLIPVAVQVRGGGREVQFAYAPLAPGQYRIVLVAENLKDRAGNALQSGGVVSTFEVRQSVGEAEFNFQGNFSDSGGGLDLTAVGTTGQFVEDDVFGVSQMVYAFGEEQGLEMNIDGRIDPAEYSIEMIFQLSADDIGYQKLIDFENQTRDTGLYTLNNDFIFYNVASGGSFLKNRYYHLVLTRNAATNEVIVYVNGLEIFSFTDNQNIADVDNPNNSLRFFIDDHAVGGENTAGRVALLRVYDRVLTAAEVLDLSPVKHK